MKNLLAEMARYNIKRVEMQKLLGCTERTLYSKLNGESEFTLAEAFLIRDTYFSGMKLEYLFAA